MSKIKIINAELATYLEESEDIKASIKTIAENKDIPVINGTDTPSSVLTKIDNGTIKTPTAAKLITQNDTNIDVLNYAKVNVAVYPVLQSKTQSISTNNTTTTITPDSKYYGMDQVKITTSIPGYTGSTSVTPDTGTHTLPTSGKYLSSNITVNAIPSNYKNTNGTNATASDILSGKIAVNTTGTVTGNIQSYSGGPFTPTTSAQTIPAGGKYVPSDLTINPIPSNYKDVSNGTTATTTDVLSGKSFYNVNGTLTNGSIQTYSGSSTVTSNQTLQTAGKYVANNIVVSVSGGGSGGTDVSDTTATPADVLSGKYYHKADGSFVEGTIQTYSGPVNITTNQTLATSGTFLNQDIVVNVSGGTPVPQGYITVNYYYTDSPDPSNDWLEKMEIEPIMIFENTQLEDNYFIRLSEYSAVEKDIMFGPNYSDTPIKYCEYIKVGSYGIPLYELARLARQEEYPVGETPRTTFNLYHIPNEVQSYLFVLNGICIVDNVETQVDYDIMNHYNDLREYLEMNYNLNMNYQLPTDPLVFDSMDIFQGMYLYDNSGQLINEVQNYEQLGYLADLFNYPDYPYKTGGDLKLFFTSNNTLTFTNNQGDMQDALTPTDSSYISPVGTLNVVAYANIDLAPYCYCGRRSVYDVSEPVLSVTFNTINFTITDESQTTTMHYSLNTQEIMNNSSLFTIPSSDAIVVTVGNYSIVVSLSWYGLLIEVVDPNNTPLPANSYTMLPQSNVSFTVEYDRSQS